MKFTIPLLGNFRVIRRNGRVIVVPAVSTSTSKETNE